MQYWNPTIETAEREQMRTLQDQRFVKMVEHVYYNVERYRHKMQEKGLLPGDIKGIDDIHKLPFTEKSDLRDTYPFGLFAVSQDEIVRLHASSGTTGKSIVVGYTRRDLDTWSEVCARGLTCAGADRTSKVQIAHGYGLFTGGLGVHYGVEKIGATAVPASTGNTRRQVRLLMDFGVNILNCTPSYALYIAEEMEAEGLTKADLSLTGGIFGAEVWTESMRKEIEDKLGIVAIDLYGLSEIMGPGVAFDCPHKAGLHINEDYFYPEIIDPDTGVQLPPGETGELVFTTLDKEGFPMLRYRTRDLSSLHYETCACGRTLVRMKKIMGRSDDMLIIRGVNVFPSQVETVLLDTCGTSPHYLITVERQGYMDYMEIQVEITPQMFSDNYKDIDAYSRRIAEAMKSTLGISAKIRLVDPKTLERQEGKVKRVIDKRNLS